MRILFICKKNEIYGFHSYARRSSGLFNSTSFIVQGLKARGIHAAIIEVNDNNDIDREVKQFKPDVVVIEALWVVPEKFDVLKPLHPNVQWFVHLHSNMPFLALEGIAMGWILDCVKRGVGMIANSPESYEALRTILHKGELTYLPNVYIHEQTPFQSVDRDKPTIDIGCFGALRPMKNHLLQALAAIKFAREKRKHLKFYVNATRLETGGQPVLKNLVQLFERLPDAELVQVAWHDPVDFLALLRTIDLGMQVSLTETFNVVSADYATAGLPIVASKEVPWINKWCVAEDNSVDNVVRVMHRVWNNRLLVKWNQWLLRKYSANAQEMWFEFCQQFE